MAQFKSPGMESRERFIGGSVRKRPTGRAGIVAPFEWGPVNTVVTITDTTELASVFGTPNDDNYNDFFQAWNYLQYASDLRVVRVINEETARNSSGIFDQVDYRIVNPGTGYSVGDNLIIQYENVNIEEEATITQVGASGEIERVSIPSGKIIKKLKELNTYPVMSTEWKISISGDSEGVGALIEASTIATDSGITIINSDFAQQSLDSVEFGEVSVKYGLPRIATLYAGKQGDRTDVEIVSYDRFHAEQRGELTIHPYGTRRPMYARDYFRYGPANEDQYAIVVYVNNERRETHIVSTNPNDTDPLSGRSIFMDHYFDVGSSEYITMIAKDFPKNFSGIISLGGGTSSTGDITASEYMRGLNLIRDDERLKINTLIAGGVANRNPEIASTVQKYASSIGDALQNLVVVVDPLVEDVVGKEARVAVDNMVKRRGSQDENNLNINSTYTVITGNYGLQYDPYNNVNRWVSLSGDMAGLMAQADNRANPAQSPAGADFGVIQNKYKLAINPNKTLRDKLTTVSINPVISLEEGSGFMFYADLTATYEQSHYDHINNRRVANYIKELFEDLGAGMLFKNNTQFTRLQFKTTGDAILRNLSGNTIEFGRVWCDERNNPDDVVFRKEFVATIYYKPYNSINYVLLNFVSVESGTQIEEDVVRQDQLPKF